MLSLFAVILASTSVDSLKVPQPAGKKDVLLWQVQLTPDQCSNGKTPCWNIYAVNQTQGDLLWYAYTTSSSGVKAMSVVSLILQLSGAATVSLTPWELLILHLSYVGAPISVLHNLERTRLVHCQLCYWTCALAVSPR